MKPVTVQELRTRIELEGIEYSLMHYFGKEALMSIENDEVMHLAVSAYNAIKALEDRLDPDYA